MAFLGNGSWSVNSVPSCLKGINIKDMIYDVIDSVTEGGHSISAKVTNHIALSSAKAAAIQYGQPLTQEDMDVLVAKLFASSEPKYTPDGKLIISPLSYDDITKMFAS